METEPNHPSAIPLPEKPYVRHIFTVAPQADNENLLATIQNWVDEIGHGYEPDEFGEESKIILSETAADGSAAVLQDVKTTRRQRFHAHIATQATEDGTITADSIRQPTSHRMMLLVTGKNPGHMEWFKPEGALALNLEKSTIQGAFDGPNYKLTLPPYSCVALEVPGGIHRFDNMRILSYHPYETPASEQEQTGSHTVFWDGKTPRVTKHITPAQHPLYCLVDTADFNHCIDTIHDLLENHVKQGPKPEAKTSHLVPFIEQLNEKLEVEGAGLMHWTDAPLQTGNRQRNP